MHLLPANSTILLLAFGTILGFTGMESEHYLIRASTFGPGGVMVSEQAAMWAGLSGPASGFSSAETYAIWAGVGVLHWSSSDADEIETEKLPLAFTVLPSAPNPSRAGSVLRYSLPSRSEAGLEVFDATGRLVREITMGALDAGWHSIEWNGRTGSGASAEPGIYFWKLRTSFGTKEGRIILVK